MNNLAFWNEWRAPFQLFFKFLVLLLVAILGTFLFVHLGEYSPFYQWSVTGYLDQLSYSVFSNHSEFIESSVDTDLPLILQKVFGTSKMLPTGYTYVYLIGFYAGLTGCLAIATFLQKFWYYLSMGLWMLLMMLGGIGKIGFFGLQGEVAIILLSLLFIPTSYYFNTINQSIGLGTRFLAFLGLAGLMLGLIHFGSAHEAPLLFLARFSYLPAILIALIFILIIGHEIVYAILSLTTPYSKSSTNNTTHFIVLSAVYLLNLAALYLKRIGYLNWDIYYLNEFLVFFFSALLGIWGIRSRQERYGKVLPFYPYTLLLYLLVALLTGATLLFQVYHANDPFIESIRNLILYSHIGFGSMFFLYIIGNFITQLRQNLPVHQFAYVEDNFPYISARLAGLIVASALFFRAHYSSYYLGVAGYYNGVADLNLSLGNKEIANHYYRESAGQSRYNHHANFQLAQSKSKPKDQLLFYKNALKRNPTAYSYASLGKAFENSSRFFDAIFTYQEGIAEFPDHWALKNNLALLYNKTNVVDSAIYYLEDNRPGSWKEVVVSANLEAVLATHRLKKTLDTQDDDVSRFDIQSNRLARKLMTNDTTKLIVTIEPSSPVLNLYTYSYLKNLGIYCYINKKPEYLKMITPFLSHPENGGFNKELTFVKALNLYQAGKIAEAMQIIYEYREVYEEEAGKWNSLLGKWCLELNAPLQASKYFELAREEGYDYASTDLAQAYNQMGDKSLALFLLSRESQPTDSMKNKETSSWQILYKAMQNQQANWQVYSFEKEKDLLNKVKQAKVKDETLYRRLGLDNPYFVEGVLFAADYFHDNGEEETAYNFLHQAMTINQYSEQLIKAYITYCLKTNLIDFADDAIAKLAEILSEEKFSDYLKIYEYQKSRAESDLDQGW